MSTATSYLRSAVPRLQCYGGAVGLSLVALILMLILRPLMEPSVFFLFLAAVAIIAAYCGLGPGLLATLISALAADFFFLTPYYSLLTETEETLRLVIFLLTGLVVSWLAQSHNTAEDGLRARNEELERWAAQRTLLEKQFEWVASHDYLTDLYNQAFFYEHLGRALSRARRHNSKVALLYMDLDDFKFINDSLGHQEGDRVLREVATRLNRCLREADVAARIGGDEFAVLLEDVVDARSAVGLAECFQAQLRVPFDSRSHRMYTSVSIGIALSAQEPPEELVRAADLAMYQAKHTGKAHHVVVFDPDSTTGSPT